MEIIPIGNTFYIIRESGRETRGWPRFGRPHVTCIDSQTKSPCDIYILRE